MDKKKIAIIGASGFVGSNFHKFLEINHSDKFDLIGTYFLHKKDKLQFLDVTDKEGLNRFLRKETPDYIFWFSGKKQAYCQENYERALEIHLNPIKEAISLFSKERMQPHLIYLSTDYVFKGDRGNYSVEDSPEPCNNYGLTRFLAEKELSKSNLPYKIIRASAIMGPGGNFFEWMLNKLEKEEEIRPFDDLFFTPTPLRFFLKSMEQILLNAESLSENLFHISSGKRMSRYDFVSLSSKLLGKGEKNIIPEKFHNLKNKNSSERNLGMDLSLKPHPPLLDDSDYYFEKSLKREISQWKREQLK